MQAQADKRQGAHKSVGAQLRRTNQIHFEEKITNLLKEWKEEGHFGGNCLKMLHVPHYARKLYFNENALDKEDSMVRSIPFSTVKPGLAEANRVFTELFSLTIWTTVDLSLAAANKSIQTTQTGNKHNSSISSTVKILDLNCLKLGDDIANTSITQEDIIDINKKKKSEYHEKKVRKRLEEDENVTSEDESGPFSQDFSKNCPRPSFSNDGNMALSNALDNLLPEKKLVKQINRERRLSERSEPGEEKEVGDANTEPIKVHRLKSNSRSRSNSNSENKEQDDNMSVIKICACGTANDLEELSKIMPSFIWANQPLDANGRLPLHIAARSGNISVLNSLLRTHEANPELSDKTMQTPYEACRDKTIRNLFRIYRHDFPDKFDYKLAKIDDPISKDELDQKKSNKKSKAKAKKKQNVSEKLEKEKQAKLKAEQESKEKDRLAKMTPMQIEREKRLKAIEKRLGK